MSVEAATTSVHPGQDALYKVSVWPIGGAADDVTVQVSAIAGQPSPSLPAPTFTYCGVGAGTQTCTLGTMKLNQAAQLQAEIAVPSSAPSGDTATLAATVTAAAPGASTTGSITGSTSVEVVSAPPTSPTPTPTPTKTRSSGHGHSGGSGSSNNSGSDNANNSLNNLNLPGANGATGGTNGQNPSGLFPTIGPSSGTPSSGTTPGNSAKMHTPYRARTVADILPLNSGQLSGQAAGLIVLGIGLILVFARISLRKPKSTEAKD